MEKVTNTYQTIYITIIILSKLANYQNYQTELCFL